MNKIEELEERCRRLEDRVEALEEALVAAVASFGEASDVSNTAHDAESSAG